MRNSLSRRRFGLCCAGMGISALAGPPVVARATSIPELMEREPPMLETLKWAPHVHKAIQNVINANGQYSSTYNPQHRPYVVVDWNNTAIVGDVQETLFLYMLEHFSFLMRADEFRHLIHVHAFAHPLPAPFVNMAGQPVSFPVLVDDLIEDYRALAARYGHMPHPLPRDVLAKDITLQAFRARMTFCQQAVAALHGPEAAQRWMIRLVAGQTAADVIALSRAANEWCLGASITTQTWECPAERPGKAGPVSAKVVQALRLTPEMANLFQILQEHGIDPVICTSGMEDITALFATSAEYGYNLPREHVFGARLAERKKILLSTEVARYPFPADAGKTAIIHKYFVAKRQMPPLMIFAGEDCSAHMLEAFPDSKLNCLINRKQSAPMQKFLQKAAQSASDTAPRQFYLQGRDENTGEWLPEEGSILLGETNPSLPT